MRSAGTQVAADAVPKGTTRKDKLLTQAGLQYIVAVHRIYVGLGGHVGAQAVHGRHGEAA
jgi:hypothetical protein